MIINHRVGINKYFRGKRNRPNQYLGVAYSIFNTGKKFNFFDSVRKQESELELQFPAVTFSYGHAIYKGLYGEFSINYLFKGIPSNHSGNYFLYGLSVYYNYGFSFKGIFSKKEASIPVE